MAKFGELISLNKPVLIDFYTQFNESQNILKTLRDVAASLGDTAKVIKIISIRCQVRKKASWNVVSEIRMKKVKTVKDG